MPVRVRLPALCSSSSVGRAGRCHRPGRVFKSRLLLVGYTGDKKREYQVTWLANRQAKGFAILGNKCSECNSLEGLQIDHVVPEEKDQTLVRVDTRGFSWSRSWKFMEAELRKCQLLCRDCHERKTSLEKTTTEHGLTMYENHACRCDICRAAKKIENAKRYK